MNKVMQIGRLTRDVQMRKTKNGVDTATIYIAVPNGGKKNDNGDRPSSDFFRAVAFGSYAEFCYKYLRKGMQIGLTGRLKSGHYEKEGITIFYTDIYIEHIDLLASRDKSNSAEIDPYDEELPFDIVEE